ncbi:MAG: hypothetical protein R3C10_15270 [Pirellulales bacterium]
MSDADVDEYFRDLDERRRGRIVSIRAIGGNSLGDYIVGDASQNFFNTSQETLSATEAFVARLRSSGAAGLKGVLDSLAAGSDPAVVVTYEDGSRYIQLASELSTDAYASQFLWLAPGMFGRFVVRPGAPLPKANPVKPRVGEPPAPRPSVNTSLSSRVTEELPAGELRTPQEVAKARNFFERNRQAAREWWSKRNGGKLWPEDAVHDSHPRPLKDGGDPLYIEPSFNSPNAEHMIPGPDGLTDFQRWGRLGGRPPKQ